MEDESNFLRNPENEEDPALEDPDPGPDLQDPDPNLEVKQNPKENAQNLKAEAYRHHQEKDPLGKQFLDTRQSQGNL